MKYRRRRYSYTFSECHWAKSDIDHYFPTIGK